MSMRIQSTQNTQRIYDDIRLIKVDTTSETQELLTPDVLADDEEVHLFEVITSKSCQIVFTFKSGRVSHPKTIEPGRVVTFENLRPIKSATFNGLADTTLEIAIAI